MPVLICTPPHLAAEIEAAVRIGEAIRVRGIRPRRADIIAAVTLTAGNDETITDNGPGDEDGQEARHRGGKPVRVDAERVVRLSLFGPKGELRGALLEDGNLVRLDPKEAARVANLLRPGAALAARGEGFEFAHRNVVAAGEIGPDRVRLRSTKDGAHTAKPKNTRGSADQPVV